MTGPHPQGGTKWLAATGGFFGFAMQSRHGRRRKKIARRRCGKTADLGQTSLSRGRVGGGAGQDHGADGMFCGSFAAAGRGGAGTGPMSEEGVTGGFRERGARAAWRRLSCRWGRCSGARRCHAETGGGVRPAFRPVQARPVRFRSSAGFGAGTLANMGSPRWRVQRVARNGRGAPFPPSGYGDTLHCLMFLICSILRLCESRLRSDV